MNTYTIDTDYRIEALSEAMHIDFPEATKTYPLRLIPKDENLDIDSWVIENKEHLIGLLEKYGGILFRDFQLNDVPSFYKMIDLMGLSLLDYKERSSPRHEVSPKVYTSTDHPSDQVINMHNENSYSRKWPLKLLFYCETPSETGGETPIADSRKVLAALRKETRDKFIEKGIKYVRNLGSNLGLDWRQVFMTEDKAVIEAHCKENHMNFEWTDDDRLRLEYIGPAVRKHPVTQELSWFNHGYFFNILSMDPDFLEEILLVMSKEDFPFLSFYGDGTEIEPEVINEIKSVYQQLNVEFKWQKGDLLLLDNMLMAHGRNPYAGARKILVAMSEPQKHSDFV